MDSLRQNKVNSLLQKEVAGILQEEGRRLLPGGLITVTGVRVSPDLGVARVYVSLFPVKDKAAALERIREDAHHLRGALGRRVGRQMRVIPELIFHLDDTLDKQEEIDRLLNK
jgi:ribosome-binding factor A